MKTLRGALVSGSVLVVACGGPAAQQDVSSPPSPSPPPAPVASSAPAAASAPVTAATDAPKAPEKTDDKKSAAAYERRDGDVLVMVWEGLGEARPFTGKRAWVPAPSMMGDAGMSFRSVRWTLVDVVSADDKRVVFTINKKKYAVPTAAVIAPSPAATPKKGEIGRCAFGGSNSLGRFEGASGKGAACTVRFMNKTRKKEIPADGAWDVPSTLAPGAVVQVSFPGLMGTDFGDVYAVNGDDVWVSIETQFGDARRVDGPLHKVKKENVVVLEIPGKPLRKGDAVLTKGRYAGDPAKGTVAEVIDGGVAYKVKGEDVRDDEIDLDRVARARK